MFLARENSTDNFRVRKKTLFYIEPYKVGSKDIVERLKKHKRKLHT